MKRMPNLGTSNSKFFLQDPTVSLSGTGTVEGKPVAWEVTLLAAKKPVIVIGFADPDTWSKNEAGYTQLVQSVPQSLSDNDFAFAIREVV